VTTADLHAPAAAASVEFEEVAFVAVVAAAAGEASFAAEEKLVDTFAAVAVEEETSFDAFAAAAAAVGEAPFGSSTVAADFDSLVHTAAAAAVRPVASFENSLAPQMAAAFVTVDY
jgi:hypothetical protein